MLELDTSLSNAISRLEITLDDVEAIRLILGGSSVVDWQRAIFPDRESVDRYLSLLLLDVVRDADRERLRYVFNEAVNYLEEHIHLRFPPDLRNPADVRDVFVWASEVAGFRRRQILSCMILKLMHVIHHMEAADLSFKASFSEAQLCDLAEIDILRKARVMRDSGLPVVSFYGSRKSRNSVITKLIAKRETIAATIFDKLRFRIVVEKQGDILPALAWMRRNMFAFNYVIPDQTHNNLVDPDVLFQFLSPELAAQKQDLLEEPEREAKGKNEFSGSSYRMLNFIVDYPVRLPDEQAAAFGFELGRVIFVMVEFQVVDEETARCNEAGENAHHLYKQRQAQVVEQRLKRGSLQKPKRDATPG